MVGSLARLADMLIYTRVPEGAVRLVWPVSFSTGLLDRPRRWTFLRRAPRPGRERLNPEVDLRGHASEVWLKDLQALHHGENSMHWPLKQ